MNRSRLFSFCVVVLLASAALPVSAARKSKHPTCDTADACLQQLRQVGAVDYVPGGEDEVLVERLRSFGPAIEPALVEVLADPNENAAELASYALQETEHLDGRFLPQIKAGLDRGLSRLAQTLCQMEGDEPAREAVARLMASTGAPHNHETFAVQRCGRRAIPLMVEAARCEVPCGPDAHENLAGALFGMTEVRVEAGPGLLKIVLDPATSDDVAKGALWMIAALGREASPGESELLRLRAARPVLKPRIDYALVAMRSSEAASIFAERLAEGPNPLVLRDLADLGPAGVGAGPAVMKLLDNDDYEVRIAAARTLGLIGYTEATDPLIRRLDDPVDVRLNAVAAESLGRLQSLTAIPALRVTAETHWYPPVRRVATAAIEHIEQRKAYESDDADSLTSGFFGFGHLGHELKSCKKPLLKKAPQPRQQKLYGATASRKLKKLTFDAVVVGYGPVEEPEPDGKHANEVIVLRPDTIVEHRTPIKQVPHVALRVDGGWLAGSNRGEWGGELVFIGDDGAVDVLLEDNVEDIHVLGDQVIALTGLGHMFMNDGKVYALSRDANGRWSARSWRVLPGVPGNSWLAETGELLIDVSYGGTLLLRPDGTFRMAPCADAPVSRRSQRAAVRATSGVEP